MPRVTQKMIAEQLGLSPSLVSRALNGRAADIGILPTTVAKIEATAARLGYVPSAAARQLKGTGMKVLGVLAADMEDPFFGTVLAEVIRISHARSYALALSGFDRREPETRDLTLLLEQNLAGLVVAGSGPAPWMDPFHARGIPVARIGTGPGEAGLHQVGPDSEGGFADLLEHLAAVGRSRPAFIGADIPVHRERLDEFRAQAGVRGWTLPDNRVRFASREVMLAGAAGAEALLEEGGDRPDVIVCSSDAVAFGVLRVLADRGIAVPDEMAVTGFDDLPLARLTSPPLTTLRQPIAEMVATALDRIEDPPPGRSDTRLLTPLVVRESTVRGRG